MQRGLDADKRPRSLIFPGALLATWCVGVLTVIAGWGDSNTSDYRNCPESDLPHERTYGQLQVPL